MQLKDCKMTLDVYVIIFLVALLPVGCRGVQECKQVSFRREGYVQTDIDSQYDPFINRLMNISLFDCIRHVERGDYRWFLYNQVSQTCAVSKCRTLPVTTSDAPADEWLYISQAPSPSSCLDIKLSEGTTDDGEYWLTPAAVQMLGCPTKVYCHDMVSPSPKEFITLQIPNQGEYPNKSNFKCNNEVPYLQNGGVGQEGDYFFNKIAVRVETMTVKLDDYTFVTVTKGESHPYGYATDCYAGNDQPCGPKGNFAIAITGLMVDSQLTWTEFGYFPKTPSVQRSEGGAKIDIICGGICGGCKPVGDVTLQPNTGDVVH